MGNSQPNVTRTIKLLESQLGCRLFLREPRGICLTEEGEKLYAHVEAAYRHLASAQEELCGDRAEGTGTVEIGATESALHLYFLEVMRDFKKSYPGIRIKVHNHSTPEIMRFLTAGRLDFAIATTPVKAPRSVRCEKLWEYQEILVGGTQYRPLCEKQVSLKELCRYPWIGLGKGTATYEFYRDFFIRHQADMELDMEVATSDLLLPLIRNNLGIGFVPQSLAEPLLLEGQLVQIPVRFRLPTRSIQLVSEKERVKGGAAELFYQYVTVHGLEGRP